MKKKTKGYLLMAPLTVAILAFLGHVFYYAGLSLFLSWLGVTTVSCILVVAFMMGLEKIGVL